KVVGVPGSLWVMTGLTHLPDAWDVPCESIVPNMHDRPRKNVAISLARRVKAWCNLRALEQLLFMLCSRRRRGGRAAAGAATSGRRGPGGRQRPPSAEAFFSFGRPRLFRLATRRHGASPAAPPHCQPAEGLGHPPEHDEPLAEPRRDADGISPPAV